MASKARDKEQRSWEVLGGKGEVPQTAFIRCPQCKILLTPENLSRHAADHKRLPAKSSPNAPRKNKIKRIKVTGTALENQPNLIGLEVLGALSEGKKYIAKVVERCDSCHRKVVFLDVGKNQVKAFDVNPDKTIAGTHACDMTNRSESLRGTVQAGIVDSNRRKH